VTFQITKKAIKEIVGDFIERKSKLFSEKKRRMNAVEDKVIDVIYRELSREYFETKKQLKRKIEEIMVCCIEIADKLGFVKIIYDFVLLCNNNY